MDSRKHPLAESDCKRSAADRPYATPLVLAGPGHDADTLRLHQLGYAQELARHMSGFSNFAVSFTIISILSGCLTLYGFGLNTGGPAVIVWGWPFVGIMTLFVGLAMAEVLESYISDERIHTALFGQGIIAAYGGPRNPGTA